MSNFLKKTAIINRTRMVKSKKKGDSYAWANGEAELLLRVTLEYKVKKCQENFDREPCQSTSSCKYISTTIASAS